MADPKIFDDIAKVAGGAVNILSGLQQQISQDIKARVDEMATKMDLVPRQDLDDAKAVIDSLNKRIDELEKRMDACESGTKTKTSKTKKTK